MHQQNSMRDIMESDSDNVNSVLTSLANLSPGFMEAIDAAHSVFQCVAEQFVRVELPNLHADDRIFCELASKHGLDRKEAHTLLRSAQILPKGPSSETDVMKKIKEKRPAVFVRTFLLLKMQRDLLFHFLEVMKLHISSSFIYSRLNAEAMALLKLIQQNNAIAPEWLSAVETAASKSFYDNYHRKKIIPIITELGLSDHYNNSNASMHVRAGGLILGILMGNEDIDEKMNVIRFSFQETNDLREIVACLYEHVWFYRCIFFKILSLFPEIEDTQTVQDEIDKYEDARGKILTCFREMYGAAPNGN